MLFVHPDLGIGGAERLIVDAALSLKSRNHQVQIWTSHHDHSRCFPETLDGQLAVHVYGDLSHPSWLRWAGFHLPMAILRNLVLSLNVIWHCYNGLLCGEVDVIVVDQVSTSIPLLVALLPHIPILFYCHFPDKLLSLGGNAKSLVKRLYRIPFDILEEVTTAMADCIVVNSKYTLSVFNKEFRFIRFIRWASNLFGHGDKWQVPVLYPAVKIPAPSSETHTKKRKRGQFVSINRYERKKEIDLAVFAFIQLCCSLDEEDARELRLVVAGGYDPRVSENVEYHADLVQLASSDSIIKSVTTFSTVDLVNPNLDTIHNLYGPSIVFMANISDSVKQRLLSESMALIYTPANEHFGIVPIEAMSMQCLVIGQNNGGPLESVADGETGYLFDGTVDSLCSSMERVCRLDGDVLRVMGGKGRQRCVDLFSVDVFGEKLDTLLVGMRHSLIRRVLRSLIGFMFGFLLAALVSYIFQ